MTETRNAGARKFWLLAAAAGLVASVGLAGTGGCRLSRPPQHAREEPGQWYAMEAGESLGDIARRAGVPEEDLLEVNGLRSAGEVRAGRLIYVLDGPRGRVVLSPAGATSPGGAEDGVASGGPSARSPDAHEAVDPAARARFRWPVDDPRVTSYFGTRWGRPHEGIDLTAAIGTPVYAADVGEVIYAGNKVRGYGNMVVIKHAGDLMTVYAHNSVVLVHVGDRVRVGQKLALSGQSGHASGPHVHFEVRKGQVPRDPLPFLPTLRGRSPKS